ncbi:zinc finger protein Paris-like [Drosophila takahashii]|uniref:zinc finger protein Paris-like n=1 Tax=Drosophila takahashii TaxID=29030 RepID=UPI001CF8F4D7|nr:zinc finger and SCAN domain-containing protein 5B-like [Drosophila takahashii]
MTELCRVCMLNSQDMINIFDGAPESGVSMVEIISHYTGLEVKRGDSFPEIICLMCLQDARNSYGIVGSINTPVKTERGAFEAVLLKDEEVNQMLDCQVKQEFLEEDLLEEVSDYRSEQEIDIDYPVKKQESSGESESQPFYGHSTDNIDEDDDEDFGTDEPTFKCPLCPESFRREWSLQVHERTHVGRWPFKCDYCPKSCRTAADLRLHNRIHTGEKPYKCDYCDKTFRERQGLKVHIRVHTGERPYKCDYCEKTYKERKSLRVHIRNHTGERPYKCSHCHIAFADPSSLRSHVRIHTRNNI